MSVRAVKLNVKQKTQLCLQKLYKTAITVTTCCSVIQTRTYQLTFLFHNTKSKCVLSQQERASIIQFEANEMHPVQLELAEYVRGLIF